MIACAQWLGRTSADCTRGKENCVCIERGQQRYCPQHHFTGGACVMCHFNPWKKQAIEREAQ